MLYLILLSFLAFSLNQGDTFIDCWYSRTWLRFM